MKLSSHSKRIWLFTAIVFFMLSAACDYVIYSAHEREISEQTKTNGRTIAVKIQSEFTRLENILMLLEDLYDAQGNYFLQDFHTICNKMLDNDLVIGSLYFAPGGIIEYSAPREIESFTDRFNMLADPAQGPKSRLAAESGKVTVAGPHDLLEGGQGLIIRRPIYRNGDFYAMVVSVIDTEELFALVTNNLTDVESGYHYAIYKGYDETAIKTKFNYIYNSGETEVAGDIVIPFDVPNDTWYLAIEPINPTNFWGYMYAPVVFTASLYVMLLIATFLILRHQELKVQVLGMERELRYQNKLKSAMKEAQRANAAKTDFLSRMSHDIRTPINGIVGMLHIMETEIDKRETVLDGINKAKQLSNQLELLINDVLEMSRIENGKITLAHEMMSLPKCLEENAPAIAVMAQNHNIIQAGAHYNIKHENIIASPVHLQRITMNIVTNAIKYNKPGGSIECWLNEIPLDETHSTYEFITSDTGIGMSEDFIGRIFEPFSRDDNADSESRHGTGLGMAITKELVDMMGGTIDIQSRLGEGTTITMRIPFEIAVDDAPQAEIADAVSLAGKKFLLVEDNAINLEIAKYILEEENAEIDIAKNGQEAVQCFEKSAPWQYDVILMDVMMPVMNGLEAARKIRQLERADARTIPIIAMTANAFQEDVELCLQAGMNAHISKPIDIDEMKRKIAKAVKDASEM